MTSQQRKAALDILTDAYAAMDMLGADFAATQHRVYYGLDEKVDVEVLGEWQRELRGLQRRLDEVFPLLEDRGQQ